MPERGCEAVHPTGAPCHLPAHDEASGHRSDIEGQRTRWWPLTECSYCGGWGVLSNHPANNEQGWCPYCNGSGYQTDCGCGKGDECQEDNYGRHGEG